MAYLSLSLDAAPRFRNDLTVWAIRRPENATDRRDGETYERVLAIRGKPVLTSVAQSGGVNAPRLAVSASASYLPAVTRNAITATLERLLGLRVNLTSFYQLADDDNRLHELASRFRGLKPPRFPIVWEGLVNGIACQQFSLTVGILLLNRLAAVCGLASGKDGAGHAFLQPEDFAVTTPASLRPPWLQPGQESRTDRIGQGNRIRETGPGVIRKSEQ